MTHKEIDLKNPKTNRQNAGFTDEEREKMTTLSESSFTDTFLKQEKRMPSGELIILSLPNGLMRSL